MDKLKKTAAELIAIAVAELGDHGFQPTGMKIAIIPVGDTWEFRTSANAEAEAAPGYADCVAKLVQIGDHLSAQFDCAR